MNSIPSSWIVCKVGELIKVKNGYAFKSTDYTKEGFPIIRISEINNGKIDLKNAVRIPKSKVNYDFQVNNGDLLMALSGATTGKVGVFNNDEVCFQNQRVGNFKIINEESLIKGFRNYFILSKRKEIELASYGGAQPNISGSELEEMDFPLAPLNEQKRIVKKLDELLTQVDESKRRLDKIPVIIKRFRQSVLNAAVTGELTKDWRERNPDLTDSKQLLAKLLDNQNGFRNVFLREYEDDLPLEWSLCGFYNVAEICSNLVNSPDYKNHPHIAPDNIEKETGKLIGYRTIEEDKIFSPNHLFSKGMIIYSKIRPYLSKAIIAEFDGLCSADMYPIKSKIISKYLLYYILSEPFLNLANSAGTRSVLPKINQKELSLIPVPLPSIEEQKEIVKRVEALFKKADEIEERYKKAKAYVDKLTQSILAKAFRGELVPQDPNDEPAEKLLERMKAEKEKLSTEKGKRKKFIEEIIKKHPKAMKKLS